MGDLIVVVDFVARVVKRDHIESFDKSTCIAIQCIPFSEFARRVAVRLGDW